MVFWLLGPARWHRGGGYFLNQENIFLPRCSDLPAMALSSSPGPLSGRPGAQPPRRRETPAQPRTKWELGAGESVVCSLGLRIPPRPQVGRVWTIGAIFLLLFWDFQFSASSTIFSGTF